MNLSPNELEKRLGTLFDDPDFDSIHRQMAPFNVFEAVGAVRAELRHSNFPAYLLSPSRPHGLGARPLIALIRSILMRMSVEDQPIMALELLTSDLDDAIVYRERDLKYPLIYVTPNAPVKVAFWRRSSPYRSTSGRRRASGMLAMRS
jgi:hypothetical protein